MKIAIVIPVYNHERTLRFVVEKSLEVIHKYEKNEKNGIEFLDVIVIDDGSTDKSLESIQDLEIIKIQHTVNKGKGAALCTAAKYLRENGYTHMISLDADAQHIPDDIVLFLAALKDNPYGFIVGARDFSVPNVPSSSRFGRKFSAFWMFIQTGTYVSDMQSGFRAYSLDAFICLDLKETRYAFEVEVLVKAAWAGFVITEIPIQVYYQNKTERVSHFNKIKDNVQISILNTKLTVRALIPIPFKHHVIEVENKRLSLLSPLHSLQILLKQSSAFHLAFSSMISFFICLLPLLGLQSILLLLAINSLKLNRLCALLIIPITWPPFLPAVNILVGYRVIHGEWLTEFNYQTLYIELWSRVLDWIVGSLLLSPFLGIIMGILVYILSCILNIFYEEKSSPTL